MYNSWPKLLELSPTSFATFCGGVLYTLSIWDTPIEGTIVKVTKDGAPFVDVAIPTGKVLDFHIINRKLFILTQQPQLLYIVLLDSNSYTFVSNLPQEMTLGGNISLANYGSNPLIVWANPAQGVEIQGWVTMFSGNDAFIGHTEPLTLANPRAKVKYIQLTTEENLVAVTHPPNLMGAIAKVSPRGAIFYSLSPFFTLHSVSPALVHVAPFYNIGYPCIKGKLHKLAFCGWHMLAKINEATIHMKQDPLNAITTATDWITVQAGENLLGESLPLVLPENTPIVLTITANENISSFWMTTTLGVFVHKGHTGADVRLDYLGKGQTIQVLYKVPLQIAWKELTTISIQAEVHKC